jgi:hypothetical protein
MGAESEERDAKVKNTEEWESVIMEVMVPRRL